MKHRVVEADVHFSENNHRLFLVGESLVLKLANINGAPPYKTIGNEFLPDLNETNASRVDVWDAMEKMKNEPEIENVKLTLFTGDENVFLKGYFDAMPVYTPLYGVSDQNQIYEISQNFSSEHIEDALLNFEVEKGSYYLIKNVEHGWTNLIETNDEVREMFNKNLTAVVTVR